MAGRAACWSVEGFDGEVTFDAVTGPAFDAAMLALPAKWCAFLLMDEGGRPVQALVGKDLRAAVRRRLCDPREVARGDGAGGAEEEGVSSAPPAPVGSKRVDYRELVRGVRWRRVDSAFEADVAYEEIVRGAFPGSYRGLLSPRQAHFVHIDPAAPFPRYARGDVAEEGAAGDGIWFGPLEDRVAATRLIEELEATFDLCRYHQVLAQAPNGKACAYKDMGRCAAPCDGSVSMAAYRAQVWHSASTLIDPVDERAAAEGRMRAAAGALKFERAGTIKQHLADLDGLRRNRNRHVRPLSTLQFLGIHPGPKRQIAKLTLVLPGGVVPLGAVWFDAAVPNATALFADVLALLSSGAAPAGETPDASTLALITQHLFAARRGGGVLLPLSELSSKAVVDACVEMGAAPSPVPAG